MIEWKEQKFSDLNTKELYEIFKLRCEVFVVEQKILYNDFDDKDYKAIHLSGFKGGQLMAYGRIFEKGDYYPNNPGFGRVVVVEKERGNDYGKELIKKCLEVCERNFEEKEIKISAQAYLEKFYLDLGFEFRGEKYIEDGIPHCAMYYNKKYYKSMDVLSLCLAKEVIQNFLSHNQNNKQLYIFLFQTGTSCSSR